MMIKIVIDKFVNPTSNDYKQFYLKYLQNMCYFSDIKNH